jgi:hypothetical protein
MEHAKEPQQKILEVTEDDLLEAQAHAETYSLDECRRVGVIPLRS